VYSIAQDADATTETNPYILSAQLKNTGVSMQQVIEAYFTDNWTTGLRVSNLVDNGIGATHVTAEGAYLNSEVLTEEVIAGCQDIVNKIVSGELVLTMPAMEDYVF
jgi:basic membrane lipoprotein Med (substrate-binding protein (PBP1-ABC) superfamily)